MTVHKNETFRNRTINLDDNTFDGCTIEDCTLVYSGGGLPKLLNSNFNNSGFMLDGAALRTLMFMRLLMASGGKDVVDGMIKMITETQPQVNP